MPRPKRLSDRDKTETLNIAKEYARRVSELFTVKRILLYGSWAKDEAGKDSDIDIAVVVDYVAGDFLDEEIRLYRLRRDIDDRIEPILICASTDKSGFLEEIEKTGILLYG